MKRSAFAFLSIALASATIAVPGGFANAPATAAAFDQLRRENLDKDAASLQVKGADFDELQCKNLDQDAVTNLDKLWRENLDKDAFSFPVQLEQ